MASKKEGIVVVSKQVQYVIVEVKVAEDHWMEGRLPPVRAACSGEQRQLAELKGQIDKVNYVAWEGAKDDLDAAIKTVLDMVTALRLDFEEQCRKMDGIHDAFWQDITAAKAYLEETKAKSRGDADQAMDALNGRIDLTNKDLAATQENLYTTQKSLSDCLNGIAAVKSELGRNVADAEARLKEDMRQHQQEDSLAEEKLQRQRTARKVEKLEDQQQSVVLQLGKMEAELDLTTQRAGAAYVTAESMQETLADIEWRLRGDCWGTVNDTASTYKQQRAKGKHWNKGRGGT